MDFSNRFGQSDRSLFSFVASDELGAYKSLESKEKSYTRPFQKEYISFYDICNFFLTKGNQEGSLGTLDVTTSEIIQTISNSTPESQPIVEVIAGLNILSQSYKIQ